MYIKSINGVTVVYSGPSLGMTAMLAAGWTRHEGEEAPERLVIQPDGSVTILPESELVAPVIRYSKLKLRDNLAAAGMWESVKNAMTDEEYECFVLANELATDDPRFIAVLDRIRVLMPDLDNILDLCRI